MYTVKGPLNMIQKGRRVLTQKVDSLDQRDYLPKKNVDSDTTPTELSNPKPVFQAAGSMAAAVANGRRTILNPPYPQVIMPQHEDVIKYMEHAWKHVMQEYEDNKPSSLDNTVPRVVHYKNIYPVENSDERKEEGKIDEDNFEPFNLDDFWGRRILQHYQKQS